MTAADDLVRWRDAFMADLQRHEVAAALRPVADGRRLTEWTALLTAAVVRSCQALGWPASAKGHRLDLLPQVQGEYLGIDVMAFPRTLPGGPRWPLPLAAFELENRQDDDRVAYSLWKVLSVRAELRVVFAYRKSWDQARALVEHLQADVIARLPIPQRAAIGPGLCLVIGSRGQDTFPWGYFRLWRLEPGPGHFVPF